VDDAGGHLNLWLNLDEGRPFKDMEFVAGVDTSAGTGASNSCVSIANKVTKEKVAEYANPYILPKNLR
jgi:hypothetical protein